MYCAVYNELLGELFTLAAQFEPKFNNLNSDDKFIFLFSATGICFILPRPALIFLLSEETCCIILDRKY